MHQANQADMVESHVLAQLVPQRTIKPVVDAFVQQLESTAHRLNLDCRIIIGGSVAKDTYLDGDFDCDIFIRFNPSKYADAQIAQELGELVHEHGLRGAQLLHGSRDYYKVVVDDITYELVPTLDVSDPVSAPNVTDMSLFHVDWTATACRKKPGLNNQIRLMKAFCKAQRVYGAESYIGGFSGHVVDILVIYCGGFRQLLEQSLHWHDKQVIDVERHYSGRNALALLNEAKLTSPIIVVDPIVPDRNAASALTQKCWDDFKKAAASYLDRPSADFFIKTEFDEHELDTKPGVTYRIDIVPASDKKDIAGAQHVKILDYIIDQAREHEFDVAGSGWKWSKELRGSLFVRLTTDELPSKTIVTGPPVSMEKAVAIFRSIHPSIFEKDGRLWANTQRRYSHFGSLLDALQSHELVRMRARAFSWTRVSV